MLMDEGGTTSSYEDVALGDHIVGRPGLIAEVANDHGLIVGRIIAATPDGALIQADAMESDARGYESTLDGIIGAPWHYIRLWAQPPAESSHEVMTPELSAAREKRREWIAAMGREARRLEHDPVVRDEPVERIDEASEAEPSTGASITPQIGMAIETYTDSAAALIGHIIAMHEDGFLMRIDP